MNDPLPAVEIPRPTPRSTDPEILAAEIIERLTYRIGKDAKVAKPHDWLTASILVIRDRIIDKWMESTRRVYRSEEHTSELQSLMRISYAYFCWQQKQTNYKYTHSTTK